MKKNCVYLNNTESPDEIITSLAIREGDIVGNNFMKYKGVVPDVYRRLNLFTLKYTKRFYAPIDKRTNSIILPDDFLFHSSISTVDECNKIEIVSINQQLSDDIIDMSLDHDCHCECGCKSDLCGMIKSYEAIVSETEEEMPGGGTQTFQSVTRKRMDANGRFVIERTFPVRIYGQGDAEVNQWLGVELKTEIEELCHLETDPCGCVKNSNDNVCKVNACCNADSFPVECGTTLCATPSPTGYNFTEQGNRITFPASFGFDKALVRYYAEAPVKDLRVPLVAKPAFILGLKNEVLIHDDSQPLWRIREIERKFEKEEAKLFTLLNRFSIKEVYQVLNPYRYIP